MVKNVLQRKKRIRNGQATLEFTLVMAAVVLLILALARVFTWTGRDMAQRRKAHDDILMEDCGSDPGGCPLRQLRDVFFVSNRIEATASSNLFGDN